MELENKDYLSEQGFSSTWFLNNCFIGWTMYHKSVAQEYGHIGLTVLLRLDLFLTQLIKVIMLSVCGILAVLDFYRFLVP